MTIQQMLLSARNTSYAPYGAGVTWNPADKDADVVLSGGDLVATISSASKSGSARVTAGKSSGKWYWEVTVTTVGVDVVVGIGNASADITKFPGLDANGWGYDSFSGHKFNASDTAYGSAYTTGDVIGVALDLDGGAISFYKNGVSQGQAYTGLTGTLYPMAYVQTSPILTTSAITANFGATSFAYLVP